MSTEQNEPHIIQKLDEVVVNRIAAGEVIQRPANALKELLENSIDAKSTNISIIVKSGGLKYLQIQDNGTGIRKDDLEIVCERFTTSKLRQLEDLNTISTYGFRGEALASISHVAHLTILTKTRSEQCAYRASYSDGKLIDTPVACAGNQGTQITVEDLFYNMPNRKNAFKNPNDEYVKIIDVVSKYAVHNSSIGFTLKKFGGSSDLKLPRNSNCKDNIRLIYGASIAKELLEIQFVNDKYDFKFNGLVTNANFSTKKSKFVLFINNRLVDCVVLRKSIELLYNSYLPKGFYPFVYISLNVDPNTCDVNVHPTKHEVQFLNEEQIVGCIKEKIEHVLANSNTSRTMYVQTRLAEPKSDTTTKTERTYDKHLIRTDNQEKKLTHYFGDTTTKSPTKKTFNIKHHHNKKDQINVRLLSVLELRKSIESKCDQKLRELLAQHKFVGTINRKQSLIQFTTKLYLCNTEYLAEELFYQIILYDFQNFDEIQLNQPLCIYNLVMLALEFTQVEYNPNKDGTKEDIAQRVKKLLIDKSAMLQTYFAMNIDSNGNLLTLPSLLNNYLPDLTNLPLYLLNLAVEVNWDTEQDCFNTFARQTAKFYSHIAIDNECVMDVSKKFAWTWVVEHVLYSAFKLYLLPDDSLKQHVLQIANLPDLYRVFERC